MRAVFDPKPCPNRAQNAGPLRGPIISVGTSGVTESHRSELNRRPLLSFRVAIRGIFRLFNSLTPRLPAFPRAKTGKSRPETVPEPCLFNRLETHSLTNPLLHFRFSKSGQMELERAVREELRAFAFRRHY